MNLFINAAGDKPMYEQVKDGIKEAILSGELKAHQLMPSVRQLAADLNVSMITTKRAYSDLERDGLIYTVAGKGTFVKTEDIGMLQEKHIGEVMEQFIRQAEELKRLGVPIERLDNEMKKIYGGNDNE
ncbi:MAG: GntR family transcriptional regulator [Oscillospiraceae bacterium]|nr:GntR family transcriptional regulator [Oscillospiraceae bacterium]MDE7302743.1 GntR family transcriptional regulator [Oscillospiraceae bacterium]